MCEKFCGIVITNMKFVILSSLFYALQLNYIGPSINLSNNAKITKIVPNI
jgi:hypothetical protein